MPVMPASPIFAEPSLASIRAGSSASEWRSRSSLPDLTSTLSPARALANWTDARGRRPCCWPQVPSDLGADTLHRAEVAHRVLEAQDPSWSHAAYRNFWVQTGDFLPVELDGAADHMTGASSSPSTPMAEGFAGTGLAYDGHPLARVDGEGDVAYRMTGFLSVVKSMARSFTSSRGPCSLLHGQHLDPLVFSVIVSPLPRSERTALRVKGIPHRIAHHDERSTVMANAADG